jgi:diguanylate cyclase (GGDEF)-like protein
MVVHDDDNVPMTVTASLGLTTFRPGDTVESLIDRADHAMYAAKTAGRNRVVADVE